MKKLFIYFFNFILYFILFYLKLYHLTFPSTIFQNIFIKKNKYELDNCDMDLLIVYCNLV